MTYVEFGKLIKDNREKLGWDQATLAKTMRVKQQSVSRWEKGQSRPDADTVVALAEVLQTEINTMLAAAAYELPKPVRPLLQVLPLGSLTAENFELFCRAFIAALNPGADVSRYGSQGDTQEGIDLFSKKGKQILDYQCKRHLQFGPADIDRAVVDTTFESEHHHLLLSRKATPAARKAMNKHEQWSLWDIEDVSAKIQQDLPKDKALRIVDTFFPGWRKDFLGEPDPSPWLTPEEFFRPLANRVKLFNHDWSFVGRQKELEALDAFVGSESERVLTISGRGGVGKSRLLRAFSDRVPAAVEVRFTSSSTDIKPRDFELLPTSGLLVIDDAHENPDLSQLLGTIALTRPSLKVLISTRPYGLPQIQNDLTRSGFGFKAEDTVRLNDLTTDEAKALAEEIIKESHGNIEHAKRIVEITKDCPLATVIGSRLVATGRIQPELLNNSEEFREHILMTFRNIIAGEIGGPKGSEDIRSLLEFVAMIQPIDPTDPAFEAAASAFLERRYDKILRDLRELEDAGVLLRRRNRLRIAPDLLADYIRADVAYDSKNSRPTGYADAVFKMVKDDLATNLLVNLSQLDWRISATGVQTALLNSVWADLEAQFKSAKIYTRQAMLKALEKVAYYQPAQALSFAKLAIEQPTTEVEPDDGFRFSEPSYNDVLTKIPPVLKYVGYNHEYLPEVLDLLKELAKQDTRQQNQYPEHPMRALSELAGIEPGKPLQFNETVVDHVINWLQEPSSPNFSPFDVLDNMLATEGHQSEFRGITLTLRPYKVRAEAVAAIRAKIVDAAFEAVHRPSLPDASRALKTIQESLQNPWGTDVTDEDRAQWQPGQLAVLERLKNLASDTTLDPYIAVEIRGAVSWHATYSKGPTKPAAKAVLAAIPTTIDYEISRAFADGWGHTFERSEDYSRNEAAFVAWRKQLAHDVIEQNTDDFGSLITQLEERAKSLHEMQLTRHGDGGQFIAGLVLESPEFGKALGNFILKNQQSPLAGYFGSVLMALADNDHDAVLDFVEAAMETKNLELLYRVSWALGWGMRGTPVSTRETAIIKALMNSSDALVRKNIVRTVERFEPTDKALAIDMLLAMKFDDKMELADEVLGQFGEHGAFKVSDLSEPQVEAILTQLVKVDSLDDYNIGIFLGNLSAASPEQALKLLMDRIEYRELHEHDNDYKPLPYSFSHGNDLRFHTTPAYEKLLRTVRDWSVVETGNWIRPHFGRDLFKAVSAGFDEVTLRVLNEWVMSPDQKNLEAAASLLSEIHRGFLWDNPEYVVNMLNRAQQHGAACHRRVSSYLHTVAFQGSRSGTPGQPFPEDIEQRDRSQEMMEKQPTGSSGYRFYKSLHEIALSNIKRDTIDEEDLFDD